MKVIASLPAKDRRILLERTFWEKAALLHEQNTRAGARPPAPRQARHLSDIVELWQSLSNSVRLRELFPEVIAHRRAFFDYTWVDYANMTPSSLKLIPSDLALPEWQADYKAMQSMFHSTPPDFQELLAALKHIESSLQAQQINEPTP